MWKERRVYIELWKVLGVIRPVCCNSSQITIDKSNEYKFSIYSAENIRTVNRQSHDDSNKKTYSNTVINFKIGLLD